MAFIFKLSVVRKMFNLFSTLLFKRRRQVFMKLWGLVGLLGPVLASIFLSSCSTMGLAEQQNLRTAFTRSDYQTTGRILADASYYTVKKNALLAAVEKGMQEYALGHYRESLEYLQKAKELIDQYFTKSISQTTATYIANDTSANYVGESYERSLVYFYAALNHFHLAHAPCTRDLMAMAQKTALLNAKAEKEGVAQEAQDESAAKSPADEQCVPLTTAQKRQELFAARAELVAWHSYLQNLKHDKAGQAVFKDDLLACLFGGLVHEAVGGNDLQIAWQLYRDGLDILAKNYNAYPTFNLLAEKFTRDYEKLPKMPFDRVLQEYVRPTTWGNQLKDYLTFKFLKLTKKLHSNKFESYVAQLRPSAAVLERLKKEKAMSNVAVVVGHDLIANKQPHKVAYSLGDALKKANLSGADLAQVYIFASNVLGLQPKGDDVSMTNSMLGTAVTALAVNQAAISFEIPEIVAFPVQEQMRIQVLDENQVEVYSGPLTVVNPVSEMAAQALKEKASGIYTRLGARLATKHAIAIMAAFLTYNKSKKDNEFMAKLMAVAQYALSSKAIAETEKADIRFWATLPADYRLADFYLSPGTYQLNVEVLNGQGEEQRTISLGKITIVKDDPAGKQIASYRVY